MRKIFLILWCVLFMHVFPSVSMAVESPSELNGKVIGSFTTPFDNLQDVIIMKTGITPGDVVTFNDNTGAYAALRAGRIDGAYMSNLCGRFYQAMEKDVVFLPSGKGAASTAHMAFRRDSKELKDIVDSCIEHFKSDGTLKKLQQQWIDDLEPQKRLAGKDIPVTPGAPTYRVGGSGDFPPLDYMAADGRAAGYSVALLAEIARRSSVNFEIIPMSTEAKRIALNSGKVDALFIVLLFETFKPPFLDDALISLPYFRDEDMGFLVKR